MKRKIFLFTTLLFLLSFKVKAQQNISAKSNDLEINLGFSFGGPVNQMKNYLIAQGYDATYIVFFGAELDYPLLTESGASISLNYSWTVKNKQKMGLRLGYSNLGTISGGNDSGQGLDVGFRTISSGIFYQFTHRPLQFRIGPSVLFNIVYDDDRLNESQKTIDSGLTLGVFADLSLYLWNGRRTYGAIAVNYTYSISNKFGPYPTDGFDGQGELPETKINFKHATASFTFGIHL